MDSILTIPMPAFAEIAPPAGSAPAISLTPSAPTASAPTVGDAQLRMILDVSRMLAVPRDVDWILCKLAEASCGLLRCERASIFLYDAGTSELWTKVALKSGEIRVPCTKGIVGHAFSRNEILHVPDPYADPRFNPEPDRRSGFVTRNLLSAPMKGLDGKPHGVIQCVNRIDGGFDETDLALIELLADQAGVAIQRHLLQLDAVRSAGLRREAELAKRAQEKLIPKSAPPVEGLEAVGWTLPASTTGGDCYDLWQLPDGRLGVLVADASGHGLAPAMIVSQARSLVRALSETEPDPHRLLVRVNRRLMDDLECGQFVTAFLGFLSGSGELHWSSAGHGPVFVRPRPGPALVELEPPVQPLGILDWDGDAPAPLSIEPGGSLILVSDGIFEAPDPDRHQFGIDRMIEILNAQDPHGPGAVVTHLRRAVTDWHADDEPVDDQTIVVVRRK